MSARAVLLALATAVVALLAISTWQERRYGYVIARDEARADSIRRLHRSTDSLRSELERQVPVAIQWRDRWRTLVDVDTLQQTDTVRVAVQVLVTADSAIDACHTALSTCIVLQDSLQRVADLWQGRHADAATLAARPWTSTGLALDELGGAGLYVDRDLWRLRLGASFTTGAAGPRGQLRVGVRW